MLKEKGKTGMGRDSGHLLDTEEVASSILVGPTISTPSKNAVISTESKDFGDLTRPSGALALRNLNRSNDTKHNSDQAEIELGGVKKRWTHLHVAGRGGAVAKVDLDVFEWASRRKWRLTGGNGKFYVTSMGGRRPTRLHRLIMNPPPGMVVDHVNGDPLDNRRSNLRVCTQAENLRNRGLNRKHPTGHKGVLLAFPGRCKPYVARIQINGKMTHLGCFSDPEEAAEVVRLARESA